MVWYGRLCDIIRGEKFDAWNLAFKDATLEALTEKNLDAAYFKSSGGRKRGRTDGRRSAKVIAPVQDAVPRAQQVQRRR